jgi:hypothetical protein
MFSMLDYDITVGDASFQMGQYPGFRVIILQQNHHGFSHLLRTTMDFLLVAPPSTNMLFRSSI